VGEVGGGEADHHRLARRDRYSGYLQGLGGEPERRVLHRPLVAQCLLDGAVDQGHVGAQGGQLVGVGEQGVDGVGDEVDRRLVARDQQDEGHAAQLLRGEPVAVLSGGADQVAQQVVAGARAALVLDEFGEVLGEAREGVVLALGARRGDRLRGDLAELRAVHLGHAEQFADDGDGQRVGEGVHEVGAPLREHRVEQFVGDLLDPRAQFLHPAHRERACDQAPQAGVLGRVGDQQILPDQILVEEGHPDPAAVLGESGVGERRAGLLVPDDEPGLVVRVGFLKPHPVHRALGTQSRVHGVRVRAEPVAELPEVDHFHHDVPPPTAPRTHGIPD
jgi:hypothetical protein